MIKVCPVVTRTVDDTLEILLFRHPLAGIQLVKGTLEADETITEAALRELEEESGITEVAETTYLCQWQDTHLAREWHFIHCKVDGLPDTWTYFTNDDGGHLFAFFWQPLIVKTTPEWHPVFVDALHVIQENLI